jgi:nicotinate-nucleotide--dimethylbenzimidazole phosphoribosyltransferase
VDADTSIEFGEIEPPSDQARSAAIALHGKLVKPAGSLGRLEELGVWISAVHAAAGGRVRG